MEYPPIRIRPPRLSVRRYPSELESRGFGRSDSFHSRSRRVPSYPRQPLHRRSSFSAGRRIIYEEPDDGENRRTYFPIDLGSARRKLVDEEQGPRLYFDIREKRAQTETDDVRPTQRHNVKDVHIRRSRRAIAEEDGKNPIILTNRPTEAQHNGEDQSYYAHWRHMEGNEFSFEAFMNLALQTPGLDNDNITLVHGVLEKWRSQHERGGVDGSFFQAGAIQSDGFDFSRQSGGNKTATFFCLPYLSIDPPTHINHQGVEDKSLHPVRTLLQWRYHSFPTKDRDNQTLEPCKGGILHVPQIWGLIVNSKHIITAAPFPLSNLEGTTLRIEEVGHIAEASLIQFISINRTSYYFPGEQCMTWFEMMEKVQSTFDRPEDLENFNFIVTDTQNVSKRVSDKTWSTVIKSKNREHVALRMESKEWKKNQRRANTRDRKAVLRYSSPSPAEPLGEWGGGVGSEYCRKDQYLRERSRPLSDPSLSSSPGRSSESGDLVLGSESEGRKPLDVTNPSLDRLALEEDSDRWMKDRFALVPSNVRQDSPKKKDTTTAFTREPLRLTEQTPDESQVTVYSASFNGGELASSGSCSPEYRIENRVRSQHASQRGPSGSNSFNEKILIRRDNRLDLAHRRRNLRSIPRTMMPQSENYVFDKKSSTYRSQRYVEDAKGPSIYYIPRRPPSPLHAGSATSGSVPTNSLPRANDKAKRRAEDVEAVAGSTGETAGTYQNNADHDAPETPHMDQEIEELPVFTWPIETLNSPPRASYCINRDDVLGNILNELNRSLSGSRKEKAAYLSIVVGTQRDAEAFTRTIEIDSKLFKRKQSLLEKADRLSNFFLPKYHASSITGKYWGSVLSLLTLENGEWGVELLKHCSRQLKDLLEVAEKIRNGVMSGDGLQISPYRIPAALVKAYGNTVMLLVTAVIHERKLLGTNSLKSSIQEYKEQIEDMGTECLRMMQEGKDQLMQMIHTKDFTGSIDYKPVSPEAMMAKVMENALQGTSASEYPDLRTAYTDFIMHLELRIREKPKRRLLKGIYNMIEQLEVIDLVLLDQKSALSDYLHTLEDSPNELCPLSFTMTKRNIKDVEARRQHFLELKWRASCLVQQLLQSLEILNDDHGKAILVFTIVTIIFLPMSFVTSLLGMNTSDIRNMNKDQKLFWSIALPLTASVTVIALGVGFQESIRQRLKKLVSTSTKRKSS